jgi:GNAT superfamily N-acetyltransferase
LIEGAAALCWERRLFVRECDCFCFGTAMGGREYPMIVRPLDQRDIPAAAEVAGKALPIPAGFADPADAGWRARRIAHLAATDPQGAWVAEEDGLVRGVALALVRDGVWGLSLMAVEPDRQASGTGTRLLEAALGHDEGVAAASSPRATTPRRCASTRARASTCGPA